MLWDDEDPRKFVVQTEQALDEILGGIARNREIPQKSDLMRRTHSLPLFVVEDLIHRGIYDDPDAFKKWCNSPESDPWRIWSGQ